MLHYLDRKEKLQMAKRISVSVKLPMSRVVVLLRELESLESIIESASEINAERGMSAVAMGFSPYDINRVQTGKEQKRQREIESILFPIVETHKNVSDPFDDVFDIADEDLPF